MERYDKERELVKHPQALERANKIIEEGRTNMDDFSNLYGSDVVEVDKKKVEEKEKTFSKDLRDVNHRVQKERADIFEAIIFNEGGKSTWFGEKSSIILPTKFDDYFNGADSLIEVERQGGVSVSAISLDVTYTRDVLSKINSVVGRLRDGTLSKVKYYQSVLSDIRGEIRNIPHFVIGVDGSTLDELTNLFADLKDRQLELHLAQFQIIELIILQSDAFADLGRIYKNEQITKAYERIGRIFREIYGERGKTIKDFGTRDTFFSHFKTVLEQIVAVERKVMGGDK